MSDGYSHYRGPNPPKSTMGTLESRDLAVPTSQLNYTSFLLRNTLTLFESLRSYVMADESEINSVWQFLFLSNFEVEERPVTSVGLEFTILRQSSCVVGGPAKMMCNH